MVVAMGMAFSLPASSRAANLFIGFDDGTIIVDGGALDLDGVVNDNIDFAGIYSISGYFVKGSVYQSPPFPVGPTLTGLATHSLTLTDFYAEALATSTLGGTLDIRFQADFLGAFGAGIAFDLITPFVENSLSLFVPASTDSLNVWQSYIYDNTNSFAITPPAGAPLPSGNPFYPGTGSVAYPVSGNGPIAIPAMTNPTLGAMLQIQLGQIGDRFLLPSSAEVGIHVVPELGSSTLAFLGFLGVMLVRRRLS